MSHTGRWLLIASFLALPACAPAEAQPPAAPAQPAAPAPPQGPAIAGEIVLGPHAAPARGTLVLGWLAPAEAEAFHAGKVDFVLLRRLIERLRAAGEVDFASTPRVPYRIEAPADAVPLVVLDVDHAFWSTFEHGAPGLVGFGSKGGGEVALDGGGHAPERTSERCAGDRFKLIVVDAPEVAGSVGNPTSRRFCAYLPPSYRAAPARHYPLVLLFSGFGSGEMARLLGRGSAAEAADALARETGHEAVLVGVDTSTRTGSTYLEDSPVTGAFDTFLARRGLDALDAELRTIRRREARGLVGHSTGGLNALSFGMRHPDRFSAIGASSPDAPDLRAWLFEADGRTVKPWIHAWTRLEDALGGPGQMASYAADWSPAPARRRGFLWPFDPQTGRVDEPVLARWIAESPAGLLAIPSIAERTRRDLSGRIYLTVGTNDEFDLYEPSRRFSDDLTAHHVDHVFVAAPGEGHATNDRVAKATRFVIEHLEPSG
jgi:S-formylglutathione hydrolase FrmB